MFRSTKKRTIINEIDGCTDNVGMATKIKNYFCGTGPTLTEKIPDSLLTQDYCRKPGLPEFELKPANRKRDC